MIVRYVFDSKRTRRRSKDDNDDDDDDDVYSRVRESAEYFSYESIELTVSNRIVDSQCFVLFFKKKNGKFLHD